MNKEWKYRFAPLAALLFVAFATVVGCESKGPAERAGASIDRGVQNAKDVDRGQELSQFGAQD